MSLDGLRAWIGEVERKLGMRTRVFLVLTTIAIGIGGAAIYLAIDARENSVSESDVRALQEQLETRIDEVVATEPTPAPPNPPTQPEGDQKGSGEGGGASGTGTDSGATDNGTAGEAAGAKAQSLFQRAKERIEEAE
ncbi:MAG: hypothetical protein WA687_04915 [Solirubrobacterales bacterium]